MRLLLLPETEDSISLSDHLVLVSSCIPCYHRRTHYPLLEKPKTAAFEKQGKQCKLSDHWKWIKMLLKKNNEMMQKIQKDWQECKF